MLMRSRRRRRLVVNSARVPKNPLRADPTRTATLRRQFEEEMTRRFARFRRKLVSLVVDEDAFGLKPDKPLSLMTFNSEFASTQLNVTDPECLRRIRELQARLDPADVIELETEPHVTVRYGLTGHDPEVVRELVEKAGAVWMTLGRLSLFQQPEHDVLYLSVESQGLERLNAELAKLPHADTHDDYVPHLTIAYLKPGTGYKYLADPSFLEWQSYAFTELTFSDKERQQTEIALNIVRPNGLQGLVDNTRWKFNTSTEKVKEFLKWLEKELKPILTDEFTVDDDWWLKYVDRGFKKGAARSYDDLKRAGAIPKEKLPFYLGQRDEFLRSAFRRPESVEKVKLLAGRVFTELKGVTDAMSQKLTRTLTDGLVQGQNPYDIAKKVVEDVNGIGINRARTIARTEIIRAHSEGQLDSMERLGVDRLAVMVEWSTAGNFCSQLSPADRKLGGCVCHLCEPLEGIVLTLKEAKGLLPRHPGCRCAWVPANVGENTEDQIRTAAKIGKAIKRSMAAGKPKRGKSKSTWLGATRKIGKVRPRSKITANVFCKTGEGGGVDPTCSPNQRGVGSPEHTVPPTEKTGIGLTAASYIEAAKLTAESYEVEVAASQFKPGGRFEKVSERWLNKVHEDVVKIESNVERLEKRHQSSCDALDKLLNESASLAGQVKGDLSENDRELLAKQVELNKKIDAQAEKVDKALSSLFKARRERTDKALKVIRDFNKDGLQPTFDKTMKIGETHDLPGYQQEAVEKTEKALRGLLHSDYHGQAVGKTHVRLVPEDAKQRAYFSGERHGGDHSMFITKSDGVATVAHEFGHAMETNELVHFAAKGFLYHRVGKEVAKPMGAGYDDWEVGMDDEFKKAFPNSARYVGKFYKSRDTEVISMGMEKMITEPVHFAKTDPEYFKFMVGVMSGAIL